MAVNVIPYSSWKRQLKENGFILCQNSDCHMGFLSLRGKSFQNVKATLESSSNFVYNLAKQIFLHFDEFFERFS